MDAISKKKSNKRASPYDNDLIGFCCQGDWIGNNVQLSNLDMQANERFLSCTPPFPLSPVISLAHSQLQSVFSFLVFSSVKTPRRLKTTSIPVHRNHSKWKNVWNANFIKVTRKFRSIPASNVGLFVAKITLLSTLVQSMKTVEAKH